VSTGERTNDAESSVWVAGDAVAAVFAVDGNNEHCAALSSPNDDDPRREVPGHPTVVPLGASEEKWLPSY
jgi:hypothetical protein